jgi:hypothetical protein
MSEQTKKDCNPSPEQIAQECARIRENWSKSEFYRRAGMKGRRPGKYRIPEVKISLATRGWE